MAQEQAPAAAKESAYRKIYQSSPDMPDAIALKVLASQQSAIAARDYNRSLRMAKNNTGADEDTAGRLIDFLIAYKADSTAELSSEVKLVACDSASARASEKAAQRTLNDLDDLRVSVYEKYWVRAKASLSGDDMKALEIWLDKTKGRSTWAQMEHVSDDASSALEGLEIYCAHRKEHGG